MSVVYWIHHPDHTDLFTQGYVGVSNKHEYRWKQHQDKSQNPHLKNAIDKYGWDNLVKKIVLIADEAYCLMMEAKLRATERIGWNLAKGGGKPPNSLGKKFGPMLEVTKQKLRAKKVGVKRPQEDLNKIVPALIKNGVATRFKKGDVQEVNKIIHTCEHCGKIGKGPGMTRWHMDKCKFKGAA